METNVNEYQGWSNYETWCANLWISNEEPSYERAKEMAREAMEVSDCDRDAAATTLADMLENEHDEFMPAGVAGVYADLLAHASGRIDWREIAASWIDDIEVYSAGWNMPGYMPDSEPALFLDAGDAMEHVKDAAKDSIPDDLSDEAHEEQFFAIEDWKADKDGEFGQTFGQYHYFVTKV